MNLVSLIFLNLECMHISLALSLNSVNRFKWMSLILQKNVPYVSYSLSLINHTESILFCLVLKYIHLRSAGRAHLLFHCHI